MAVKIIRKHNKDRSEVKEKLNLIAADLADKINIKYHWQENILYFSRLGLRGTIELIDSKVLVNVDTDFFVPITDSWLRSTIYEYLDEHLGEIPIK